MYPSQSMVTDWPGFGLAPLPSTCMNTPELPHAALQDRSDVKLATMASRLAPNPSTEGRMALTHSLNTCTPAVTALSPISNEPRQDVAEREPPSTAHLILDLP